MRNWGVSDSLKLYNMENWGDQYFSINPAGNVTVHPRQGQGPGIDLMMLIDEVKKAGIEFPVTIRFQDILRHRVVTLNESFNKAIKENDYKGNYRGVYPIKVNQLREVVEEIIDAGRPYHFGLEAGSKGELTAIIAMDLPKESVTICNGYKDHAFIKMALMGVKLGKKVIIVVEKLSDLYLTIQVAKEMGVRPFIGIRAKLATKGAGKWEGSSGDFAKFGLTSPEIIHCVEVLKREGMQDCISLLHFHIGSQISNIRTIKDAVKEATRVYAKLHQMKIPVEYLDVGGGLGVDYDGSKTNFDSSMNYTLQDYCNDVIYSVQEVCRAEEVPEPHIVSESGRALVAHHSVLLVNVFGNIEIGSTPIGMEETPDEADVVKEMRYLTTSLTYKNILEHYNEAVQRKEEALSMFKLGILSLEDRAKVEHIFWQVCKRIVKLTKDSKYVPDEIEALQKNLADQYLCNFSVFQSMPDHWAIRHLFPIVPIHRHDEEPMNEATLVDITCDSDGKVNKFIDLRDIKDTLKLHTLKEGTAYYLGFFLTGAYQDIMGDLHNLFGRVNEVHAFLDETEPGGYYVEEVIRGNSISRVLRSVQYNTDSLAKMLKDKIDSIVKDGGIKPREGVELQNFYERVLNGYTYMENEIPVSSTVFSAMTQISANEERSKSENSLH